VLKREEREAFWNKITYKRSRRKFIVFRPYKTFTNLNMKRAKKKKTLKNPQQTTTKEKKGKNNKIK